MLMQGTAEAHSEVSSVPLDLNTPVRAESIDLRVLISHRTASQAVASVESVAEILESGSIYSDPILGNLPKPDRGLTNSTTLCEREIEDEGCSQHIQPSYNTPVRR